ncbi:MAG: histidinol-phosphatase HisJ family protein [Halanaerobiales bacterium]
MIDLHVHTHHSCDSLVSIDKYCKKAIDMGVRYICFTDHIDFNTTDEGFGYYNKDKFFDEFNIAKEKYDDKLTILSGIEFSEPHIYREEFEEFSQYPYDFILGSIHFWVNDMFPSELIKANYPIEDAFKRYWEEVYKAVTIGGFDSLAHIDFPKRYYQESLWEKSEMEDIFKAMVENNIALEINTSSMRKGLAESMPDKDLLDIYSYAGGIMITLGADTHLLNDLAADYDYARSLITGNLRSTVFIERKANYLDELDN